MNKFQIITELENFAPIQSQEDWDNSGWIVDNEIKDIKKIILCLTPTKDVFNQAKNQNCEMIISHHPLFTVPIEFKTINIYSAHTNLDKANGGTTDTLIKKLGLENYKINIKHDYLRFIDFQIEINKFVNILRKVSPNLRYVNNFGVKKLHKIAFCAGSGSEFINEAKSLGADALVTGDLKFHTALDSEIPIFDIGHFESEILILPVIKSLLPKEIEIIFANEKSPFNY